MNRINNATLIKVAQINKSAKHVLRSRMMKRAMSEEEARTLAITALKKQRDKNMFLDVLGGMGFGGLLGAGIGTVGGGAAGLLGGTMANKALTSAWDNFKNNNDIPTDPNNPFERAVGVAKGIIPAATTIGGAGTASLTGLPVGAAIGGLYKLITHGAKKRNAINKLKALGVED